MPKPQNTDKTELFNDSKKHYESLIRLFKWCTGVIGFLAATFGLLTFFDRRKMLEDLERQKAEATEIQNKMIDEVKLTESLLLTQLEDYKIIADIKLQDISRNAILEVENVKEGAKHMAEEKAEERINEVFEKSNLEKFIEDVAEKRLEPKINIYVDQSMAERVDSQIENLKSNNERVVANAVVTILDNANNLTDEQVNKIIIILENPTTNLGFGYSELQAAIFAYDIPSVREYVKEKIESAGFNIELYAYFINHGIEFEFVVSNLLSLNFTDEQRIGVIYDIVMKSLELNPNYALNILNSQSIVQKYKQSHPKENDIVSFKNAIKGMSKGKDYSTTYFYEVFPN